MFEPKAYPNIADPQYNTRINQVFPTSGEKVKIKEKANGKIKEKIKPI